MTNATTQIEESPYTAKSGARHAQPEATRVARHWIDGQWRDSVDHRDSINPASGEKIGAYAVGKEDEGAAAVFGGKQLADLTIAIGMMSAYNRMAISFRATPLALAG